MVPETTEFMRIYGTVARPRHRRINYLIDNDNGGAPLRNFSTTQRNNTSLKPLCRLRSLAFFFARVRLFQFLRIDSALSSDSFVLLLLLLFYFIH